MKSLRAGIPGLLSNEMVCVAEDKLLACQDGLEGHLPPPGLRMDCRLNVMRSRSFQGPVLAEPQVVGA